jgi:hypothetical protein
MRKLCYLLAVALAASLWSMGAAAQTKFAGTCTCAKADVSHMVPVGDRADHALGVEQFKCTWTKFDIGGDPAKDSVGTHTIEANGGKVRFHGVNFVTMQSGDKVGLPYQGSGTSTKDGKDTHSKGTFGFADGTGKLKGVSGKGSFSCKGAGDGSVNCEVEGEYQTAK